jgi:hypothetical protein
MGTGMSLRFTTLGLLATLSFSGAAAAQTTQAFEVVATIPSVCALEAPALAGGGATNFRGLNGTTLEVDQLVDPRTLAARAASARVSFAAVCSFPHTLVMESDSNGLWRAAAGAGVPPGFADAVPYLAELTWGPVRGRLTADAISRRTNQLNIAVDEAVAGEIIVDLDIQPGASNATANAPLIAGAYQDTIRITLEPQ